jgi:tRNA A-37 threonylcarbamoyl transferase component Bud32
LEKRFKNEVKTVENFVKRHEAASRATYTTTAASQNNGAESNDLADAEENDDQLDAIIANENIDEKEMLRALLKKSEQKLEQANQERYQEREQAKQDLEQAKQDLEQAKQAEERQKCYVRINDYIVRTASAITKVDNTLSRLSGLSQAEQSRDLSKSQRNDTESSNRITQEYAKEAATDLRLPVKQDLDCLKRGCLKRFCDAGKLLESTEPDATYCTDWLQFDENDDIYGALDGFNAKLQTVFKLATVANTKTDKDAFRLQIRGLEEMLRDDGKPSEIVVPAPDSPEVAFVQPYLLELLRALGASLSVAQRKGLATGSLDSLQPEHQIKSGRRFVSNPARHHRTPDHTIAADARHIYMLRDDTTEITVEEKTMFTSDDMPIQLIESAKDQVCSHLAKQVTAGFEFMGYGIDTHATGAIVTPACVVLVQLRLRDTGSTDVQLEFLKTSYLPLLSLDNYDLWMKDACAPSEPGKPSPRKVASDKLRASLYPENSRDDKKVPTGLLALARLMTSSRDDLFGPSLIAGYDAIATTKDAVALGAMIGFGTFATVYKCTKPQGYVAKISRYGAKREMETEASVLKALMKDKVEGVPSALDCTTITVTLLDLTLHLSALLIKPFGVSLVAALAEKPERFPTLFEHLSRALDAVHDSNYFHNDISPKNLLWDRIAERAFLSDFGLASKNGETVYGARGNLLYIHRDIYEHYPAKPWTPKAKYDRVAPQVMRICDKRWAFRAVWRAAAIPVV